MTHQILVLRTHRPVSRRGREGSVKKRNVVGAKKDATKRDDGRSLGKKQF